MAKKIYINPGHSDKDPGAVGYATERVLTVKVSNYMKDYLLANYECEIKMNPGTMGDLYTVCKEANAWGADLFVSNHFNAGGGDGYEVWVYSEARRALGAIFEKYVKAIGQNSRGVKIQPKFIVLRDTNMPAVLNEGAFVDNKKDIQDWDEDHECKKLGEAYAKAAAEAVNLPAKKVVKPTTPKVETEADTVSVKLNVLKKGSEGGYVKTLQILLNKYNNAGLNEDGKFGNATYKAVVSYQKSRGLTADGVVGNQTWAYLLK